MAEKPRKKTESTEAERPEPFHNEPSSLDERTHQELQLMHREAAAAILFAKNIQWSSVGASLLVFGAIIAIAVFTTATKPFTDILVIISLLLAAGVVFVLLMYQFWQINEMNRIDQIERQFSTLFMRISRSKSRREGNVHRYTLLFFMIIVVVGGAVVANMGVRQAVEMHKAAAERTGMR